LKKREIKGKKTMGIREQGGGTIMAENEKTNPAEMMKKQFAISAKGWLRPRDSEDSILKIK